MSATKRGKMSAKRANETTQWIKDCKKRVQNDNKETKKMMTKRNKDSLNGCIEMQTGHKRDQMATTWQTLQKKTKYTRKQNKNDYKQRY